jgi:hypothetical protein
VDDDQTDPRGREACRRRDHPMTGWTTDELAAVGAATELDLASRADGGLSTYTTMWVVRVGDDLYVRSAYGAGRAWCRRTRTHGEGRIRAGGVERDAAFVPVDKAEEATHAAIDAAYHAKYDRYGPSIVGTVVGPDAADVTLRLEAQ